MDGAAPHRVVAIDGPAASGKSSVARELARRLRFFYVNSGAMYRAFTWNVLRNGTDPRDSVAVAQLVERSRIESRFLNDESRVLIDGVDPGEHLCEADVNDNVSIVSSVPSVRQVLVEQMRAIAAGRDVVMEGRDIGSVVFPDTPFKFYIDASLEVRMRRRAAQGMRDAVTARDQADS